MPRAGPNFGPFIMIIMRAMKQQEVQLKGPLHPHWLHDMHSEANQNCVVSNVSDLIMCASPISLWFCNGSAVSSSVRLSQLSWAIEADTAQPLCPLPLPFPSNELGSVVGLRVELYQCVRCVCGGRGEIIQLWRSVHWRYYRQLRRSLAMRIMHAPCALSNVWPPAMADWPIELRFDAFCWQLQAPAATANKPESKAELKSPS